jgi:uncharacterized membrane protein SpoIIM required for sporulation
MTQEIFIKKNSNTWRELEQLSEKINKKGIKSLSSEQVKDFLYVFRQSSHHLSYAKTYYPNSNLVKYLNSLVSKCHNNIYAVKKVSPKNLVNYISHGFPELLSKHKYYIISSFMFFAIGLVISLIMVLINSDNASIFLPQSIIDNVSTTSSSSREWNYPLMSSQIMINNISVTLGAFVLGITLGIGTIYILFFNGTILGSLTGLIYLYGDPTHYWSLILPHGIIELTAIFISGAAGLIIARSLILPGEYKRIHALIKAAKEAISLMIGVVFMLVIAGIIEGFFTPLDISSSTKLLFAALTGIILAIYFSIPYILLKKQKH